MKITSIATILLFLSLLHFDGQAQMKEAKILSIESQTKDGVVIQISIAKDNYKLGEQIEINYRVTNKSFKTIYLITDSNLKLWAKDEVLWIESPIKSPVEFEAYNYEFIKIAPKKTYTGKILLDSNKVPVDKDYDKETWKFQVGFAYLFDINGLYKGKVEMGAVAELYEVAERAIIVNVGSLIIEIDN